MSDFLEWIKENSRTVIIIVVGMIILSVIIGVLTGSAKRRAEMLEIFSVEKEIIETEIGGTHPELLLPEPIIPVESGILEYSFFFDQDYFNVDELTLAPLQISELLKSRGIGKENDVSSFNLGGEEQGVLTVADELSEP
ncbi:MAG: hypothetical protein JSV25_08990 [Spirochaetota bacterium]|nr:MAG: hypothetical protein JSV25_08990 [Spirochaetota bacterium]